MVRFHSEDSAQSDKSLLGALWVHETKTSPGLLCENFEPTARTTDLKFRWVYVSICFTLQLRVQMLTKHVTKVKTWLPITWVRKTPDFNNG